MSQPRAFVLDSSVGVKWFKPEAGQARALALLDEALDSGAPVLAPTHFAHEVLSVLARNFSPASIVPAWELMGASSVQFVDLTDAVVAEAAAQCAALGCTFYDALAPALASLLDATLVSADARAHGAYPGVRLIA